MGRQQTSGRSRWAKFTTALVCLLGLGGVVKGQGKAMWDPVKTTCNMNLGQGVVMGKKMYIDGGETMDQWNYGDGIDKPNRVPGMARWQNQHLWELDLSQKFNVSIPSWTARTKPEGWTEHYDGSSGTLWNIGDGKFYTLGGRFSKMEGPPNGHTIATPYYSQNSSGYYYQLPDTRMFAYDPQTGNWSSQLLTKDVQRIFDSASTQSARNKVGYTFGGYLVQESDFSTKEMDFWGHVRQGEMLDSMSAYNFRTGKFTFSSMPDGVGRTIHARMHSLDRVGNEGVLVAFAGVSRNNKIQKSKATGDIPLPRYRTCSVLVSAPDLSSFQIYVFSGVTEGDFYILDLYVLTIPTFNWTKIEMKNYPNEWPIADMACGLYEERQFIIVPGEVNVTTEATAGDNWWMQCNKGTAIHVFDTHDWEFKPEFDPDNKEPKVPPTIFNLIGGSETGGATLKQPNAGWDDAALGTIFSIRNELPPEETQPPEGSQPLPSNPKQVTKSNKNVIIGGAVGGVCVVALAVGILIFSVKRCRKPSHDQPEPHNVELHGTSRNYYGSYELPANYEPKEIGSDIIGGWIQEKESVSTKHVASTASTSPTSSTCSTI